MDERRRGVSLAQGEVTKMRNGIGMLLVMFLLPFITQRVLGQTQARSIEGRGFVVQTSARGEATRVYVGCYDKIFCLEAETGKIVWSHKTPYGTVDVGPILAGGTLVYIGGGGHFTIYGVDPENGRQRWKRDHRASLLVAGDGEFFVNTQSGIGVSAYDPETGRKKWAYDETYHGSQDRLMYYMGAVYTADYVLKASTGDVITRYRTLVRGLTAGGKRVFLVDEHNYLFAMVPHSMIVRWQVQAGNGKEVESAVSDQDRVFVAFYDGYPYSAKSGVIRAYAAENGTLLWERKVATESRGLLPDPIASDSRHVYVLLPGANGNETVLEAWSVGSGEKQWTYTNPRGSMGPVAIAGKEIYANDDLGHIDVLDTDSGRLLRTLSYPSPPPAEY